MGQYQLGKGVSGTPQKKFHMFQSVLSQENKQTNKNNQLTILQDSELTVEASLSFTERIKNWQYRFS